ncbi:PBP1A family penicillin-binding protein [Candidatus Babeliales bacterium]|nr:PBP1A family penicillin-binding protein [Candidatus Babeliales bacterium]
MRHYKLYFFWTSLLFFAALCGGLCFIIHNHTIDFSSLQQDVAAKPSVLLDCHGKVWGQFQLDKREYVLLEDIPQHLIEAFLVTEDREFFKHPGISFRGILRSMIVNLVQGKRVQGASTITQQLVRLKFLTTHKTVSRKIKEQLYAILVEREWSKEQILEAYLNNVYFGYGIYGVQAAAKRFWGVDIQDVTIDQAATLASVMKSPRVYSPIHAPKSVLKRRNLILHMMHEQGIISQEQLDQARMQLLQIKEPELSVIAPHCKEMIRQMLETMVDKNLLYTGGLTIQTTLDSAIQQQAQNSFEQHIAHVRKKLQKSVDGGLITIDSSSGAIRALIGGYDFKESKFNRAVQAYRQMGSIFKIFVYAAALEQGLHFLDVEIDEPFEMIGQNGSVWRPNNYDKEFHGPMTRAYALSKSNNIVAIKTLLQTGIDHVIYMARRCHIVSAMPPYPSLALGCVDVNVQEVVGSFNVVANHGVYVEPHVIAWVKDQHGNKIYKHQSVSKRVMNSYIADQIARVLMFGMQRLQSWYGNEKIGVQMLGKTGTNNDSRTCWFCGATPELTTAIYVGCDFNDSLGKNIFASKTAFPIWFKMHQNIAKTKTNFYYDPQLKDYCINWKTGNVSYDYNDPDVVALLA